MRITIVAFFGAAALSLIASAAKLPHAKPLAAILLGALIAGIVIDLCRSKRTRDGVEVPEATPGQVIPSIRRARAMTETRMRVLDPREQVADKVGAGLETDQEGQR